MFCKCKNTFERFGKRSFRWQVVLKGNVSIHMPINHMPIKKYICMYEYIYDKDKGNIDE